METGHRLVPEVKKMRKSGENNLAQTNRDQKIAPSKYICPCTELDFQGLQDWLSREPKLTFEDLLAKTGAGSVCTACLLDLEYHFVSQPRQTPLTGPVTTERSKPAATNIGLKQRLYRMIDRFSPLTPVPLCNFMPVLRGPSIEQWVCVANSSILFEGEQCAPPMQVQLIVRNKHGHQTNTETFTLESEENLRVNVSDFLPKESDTELTFGSVEIIRRAKIPGFRGTTRPQIEITAAAGSCAVHSQAPGAAPNGAVTVLARPDEERLFLTFVNAESQPFSIGVSFPHNCANSPSTEPRNVSVTVPAYGTHLHEIILSNAERKRLAGKPYVVRWQGIGRRRSHLLCATPNLDRFSIDHV